MNRTVAAVLAFAALFLAAPRGPAEVIKGPYLVEMTPVSVRVRLEADSPGRTEVAAWPLVDSAAVPPPSGPPQPRLTFRATESSYEVISAVLSSLSAQRSLEQKEERFLYEAQLTGLAPDSLYRYEVRHGGAVSGGGTFRTFPARGRDRTTFLAMGDVRTGHQFHRDLVKRMIGEGADFLTIAGDLVVDGKIYTNWQYFFDIQGDLIRNVPVFPAWGNHEARDGYFDRYFTFPDHNRDRSFFFWRRVYNHSFDCGPVHVLLLDSGVAFDSGDLRWIDADLTAARDQPWKIAVYHHPSFNEGGHGSAHGLSKLIPLLKKHRLDLTLTGHSHLYERTFPLKSASKNEQPIVHVVTGGGGAPLAPTQDVFYLAANRKVYHYLRIDADSEQMTVAAVDLEGKVFDRFVLQKTRKPLLAQAAPPGSAPPRDPGKSPAQPRTALSAGPPTGAEPEAVPEENVALWRAFKALLNTSARFRVPAKDQKDQSVALARLPWVLRVPACPLPVKLEVEVALDPLDAGHWKLTPDVDRFQWDGKKQDRLFWIQPRNAEALTREIAPRVQVRMESPFGRILQGTSLRVTFAKDGNTTRRNRI